MYENDSQTSLMPAFVRYPIAVFLLLTIAPMAMALTVPFLLFGPLAAPFCLMAFLGDWHEQRVELDRARGPSLTRRYRVRALPRFVPVAAAA